MMKCKITDKPIFNLMSFGKMPIANGFIKKKDFSKEKKGSQQQSRGQPQQQSTTQADKREIMGIRSSGGLFSLAFPAQVEEISGSDRSSSATHPRIEYFSRVSTFVRKALGYL